MNCREFTKEVAGLTLAELNRAVEGQLLSHQRECVTCASWLQQRQRLAEAMQTLRSSTATVEAPAGVEHEVLRAFRQRAVTVPAVERRPTPTPFAFRLGRFFEWGAYAAAAAALAISLGLGFWFWQHSGKPATESAQQQQTPEQQAAPTEITQPDKAAQMREVSPAKPSATVAAKSPRATEASTVLAQGPAVDSAPQVQAAPALAGQSLVQAAQAQGYTPMMLCDPLSCSGDEQVVRMEFPTTTADGSQRTQMADVVLGDDGLVRAIRIVQQ
jgi:hypothetical protein